MEDYSIFTTNSCGISLEPFPSYSPFIDILAPTMIAVVIISDPHDSPKTQPLVRSQTLD